MKYFEIKFSEPIETNRSLGGIALMYGNEYNTESFTKVLCEKLKEVVVITNVRVLTELQYKNWL